MRIFRLIYALVTAAVLLSTGCGKKEAEETPGTPPPGATEGRMGGTAPGATNTPPKTGTTQHTTE